MFNRLGHLVVRRRKTVLAVSTLGLIVAIVLGVGVFSQLSTGGFADPDAESVRAADLLEERFDTGAPTLVAVVTTSAGSVDDRTVVEDGLALTAEFARTEGTDDVASYWTLVQPEPLRSADGDRALILLRFPGEDDDPVRDVVVTEALERFEGYETGSLSVQLAGSDAVFEQVGETIEGDLARAESSRSRFH